MPGRRRILMTLLRPSGVDRAHRSSQLPSNSDVFRPASTISLRLFSSAGVQGLASSCRAISSPHRFRAVRMPVEGRSFLLLATAAASFPAGTAKPSRHSSSMPLAARRHPRTFYISRLKGTAWEQFRSGFPLLLTSDERDDDRYIGTTNVHAGSRTDISRNPR